MTQFKFDYTDAYRLAADLGDASGDGREYSKALQVTAYKVMQAWRGKATGDPHAPAYPYSISYDVHGAGANLTAEVGPDKKRRQGALGNLKEFGSVNNPPRGYGAAALQENIPDFEKGISKATDDALKRAGL